MSEVTKETKIVELPPRYRSSAHSLLKTAEKLDVGYRHRWVLKTKTGINEQMKRWGGWEPIEDKERLKRIGLGGLIQATGRATWMDTELWAMPLEVAARIREERAKDGEAKIDTGHSETQTEFNDIIGRTGAKVQPFIKIDKRETVVL
jgi:hypothetical protein